MADGVQCFSFSQVFYWQHEHLCGVLETRSERQSSSQVTILLFFLSPSEFFFFCHYLFCDWVLHAKCKEQKCKCWHWGTAQGQKWAAGNARLITYAVASVCLTMAHHTFVRCIWQNIWSRRREVLMPFYRFSFQVCHSEYCYRLPVLTHRKDGSEWKKDTKRARKV